MLAWLTDEDFNGHIVRGLLLRHPDIDLLRVQDVELMGAEDADILFWCANNDRILLTHDRATIPEQAYARVEADQPMTGVFVVNKSLSHAEVIDDIILADLCSEPDEWNGKVIYLPL